MKIQLLSPKDVDVELWDKKTGKAVIAYGVGSKCNHKTSICNSANKKTIMYAGTKVSYSGYNGIKSANGYRTYGHEYIHLIGKTSRDYVMKAFGYKAGVAVVKYSWGADRNACQRAKKAREVKQKAAVKERTNKHEKKVALKQKQSFAAYQAFKTSAGTLAAKCAQAKAQVIKWRAEVQAGKARVRSATNSLTQMKASCKMSIQTAQDCAKEKRVKVRGLKRL